MMVYVMWCKGVLLQCFMVCYVLYCSSCVRWFGFVGLFFFVCLWWRILYVYVNYFCLVFFSFLGSMGMEFVLMGSIVVLCNFMDVIC